MEDNYTINIINPKSNELPGISPICSPKNKEKSIKVSTPNFIKT